jgi:hypothetical protein
LAKINITYCIVFFGVSAEGAHNIRKLFFKKYKEKFIEEILLFIQMKPVQESNYWTHWISLNKIGDFKKRIRIARLVRTKRNTVKVENDYEEIEIQKANDFFYRNDFVKYYGGHQYRLGHYFRHLFQSFKYVNSQKKFSRKEKYFYAKTFRAQLSTYEQSILFLNSLSFLGIAWDLCPEYKKYKIDLFQKNRCKNNQLITPYNLIKNLPGENIFGIRYKAFYPHVKFEF